MKVAFVYDRLNKVGGAERVLSALHGIWPQAPFFTAVYNPSTAPFTQGWRVIPSFMQAISLAKTHHEWFPWLTPFAFESFSFDKFDVVISITSAEAKGIITPPHTLHLCYCLTPTRYLWSHRQEYLKPSHPIIKPLRHLFTQKLSQWDKIAAERPDHYLAISSTVKERIKKYYHRDAEVIYPPVDTNFFRPSKSLPRILSPSKDLRGYQLKAKSYFEHSEKQRESGANRSYFLVVSRLVPYKRIDLAVKAATELSIPLVVVGIGTEFKKLRRLGGKSVIFVGQLTDARLLDYYQECQGLIFPGEEDFGLSMLEAQSVGKPVIALRRGGATEIIVAGKTGLFFDTLTVSSLKEVLRSFAAHSFNPETIRQHAKKFEVKLFQAQFKQTVEELWQKKQQPFQ